MYYYSRVERFEPIGQKRIAAKCPDCGNTEVLELTFYQKEITTGYVIKMTKKVSGILYCHHTNTEIPPVQWSDCIEDYFNTEKEKLKLLPTGRKANKKGFKILAYIMIPFLLIITGLFIYFMYLDPNDTFGIQEEYDNAEVNDKLKVEVSMFNNNEYSQKLAYFKVNKIDGDTVHIQQHYNQIEQIDTLNLKNKDFTGEIFKVRYDSFKIGFLTEWERTDSESFSGFTKKLIKDNN